MRSQANGLINNNINRHLTIIAYPEKNFILLLTNKSTGMPMGKKLFNYDYYTVLLYTDIPNLDTSNIKIQVIIDLVQLLVIHQNQSHRQLSYR